MRENHFNKSVMLPIPCILEPELTDMAFEKIGRGLSTSGGLIQKIYEVDPLTCPKCQGSMRVIAFIEHEDIIKKILHKADKSSSIWACGR